MLKSIKTKAIASITVVALMLLIPAGIYSNMGPVSTGTFVVPEYTKMGSADQDGSETFPSEQTLSRSELLSLKSDRLSFIGKTIGEIEKAYGNSLKFSHSVEGGDSFGFGSWGYIISWDEYIMDEEEEFYDDDDIYIYEKQDPEPELVTCGADGNVSSFFNYFESGISVERFTGLLGISDYTEDYSPMSDCDCLYFDYKGFSWYIELGEKGIISGNDYLMCFK